MSNYLACYHHHNGAGFYFSAIQPNPEILKNSYTCVANNLVCLIYLPWETSNKFYVESILDSYYHPNKASNEIQITPVVHITSGVFLSAEKTAIIEIMKTVELSEKEMQKNSIIALCASSKSAEWKELGSESNCRVLKDRVMFEVTHFSLFTVISRKPHPSSTVKVKSMINNPDQRTTFMELTVPELPGFKVEISPSNMNTDEDIDFTATVHYDSPVRCNNDSEDGECFASSCIELEPHGITFSKDVCVSIPIPNYIKVKERQPDAQLQIWHANKQTDACKKLDWELVEHRVFRDEEGRYIAKVLTKHFSYFKPLWDMCTWAKTVICGSFCIKARCQVFMSKETIVQPHLMFSIAVLFYPYKEEPEAIPHNYRHMLVDSNLLDLQVSNNECITFQVELNKRLFPQENVPLTGSFVISGRQQKAFNVEIEGAMEIQEGLPLGRLSIGTQQTSKEGYHTLALIKVS